VRLSERKIKYLAGKITAWLQGRNDVELLDRASVVELAVARAISQELHLEDELDDEVERVLKTYQTQIRGQNMDLSLLRLKIKAQLAKEKGIVL
jgi:hypothetical protein